MLIQADSLESVVGEIFVAAGCSDAEAERVARRLVLANLTGHDSHGVSRVVRYVRYLQDGTMLTDRTVEIVTQSDSHAVVDGLFGLGQTVGEQAVAIGIEMARTGGVSIVGLRHAGHLGRTGDWAEMAGAAGLVSIHMMNVRGNAIVAPFGAVERRFGTNPIAIGVPREGREPIIHDFATSVVAEGKANVATQGGPSLPPGSLITGDGQLTADPTALYGTERPVTGAKGDGALRAMGDHKGSGLAFMCELLGGALTGSGTVGPKRRQFCNGLLSIYLDPIRFDDGNSFANEVGEYVEWVKTARPAAGTDEVLVPGEAEQRRKSHRLQNGIELADGTWDSVMLASRLVGL